MRLGQSDDGDRQSATFAESRGHFRQASHCAAIQSFVTSSPRSPSGRGGAQPSRWSVRFTSRRHFFRLRGVIDATCTVATSNMFGEGSANADAYCRLTTVPSGLLFAHFGHPSLSAERNLRLSRPQVSGNAARNIP